MERKTIATAFRHMARRKNDGERSGNQGCFSGTLYRCLAMFDGGLSPWISVTQQRGEKREKKALGIPQHISTHRKPWSGAPAWIATAIKRSNLCRGVSFVRFSIFFHGTQLKIQRLNRKKNFPKRDGQGGKQ
jgi:hypothetical protein